MKTDVVVLTTADTEEEVRQLAGELWKAGRRVGIARVRDWNMWYPNRLVRTASRWLVYEEKLLPR